MFALLSVQVGGGTPSPNICHEGMAIQLMQLPLQPFKQSAEDEPQEQIRNGRASGCASGCHKTCARIAPGGKPGAPQLGGRGAAGEKATDRGQDLAPLLVERLVLLPF